MCKECNFKISSVQAEAGIRGPRCIFALERVGDPVVNYPHEQVTFIVDAAYTDIYRQPSAKVLSYVLDKHYSYDGAELTVFVAGVHVTGKYLEFQGFTAGMNKHLEASDSNWRVCRTSHVCNKENKSRTGLLMQVRIPGFLELVQGTI